jgi:hypothetical protein
MPSSFMTFARRHFLTLLIMPCCLQPMQNVACAQDTAPPAAESPSASAPDAAPPSADPVADGEATPSPEAQPAGEKTETPAEVEKPAEPEVEIPFARQPYMVRASIAFEADCLVEEEKRKRIVIDIERAIVRMYGRLWETVCDQNDWMVPADHRHLGRLGVTDVIDRYPEQEFHKAFIVSIERDGTSFVISCREFDSRIHELTPIRFEVTQDERSIANTAVRLMRRSSSIRPTDGPSRSHQAQASAGTAPDLPACHGHRHRGNSWQGEYGLHYSPACSDVWR